MRVCVRIYTDMHVSETYVGAALVMVVGMICGRLPGNGNMLISSAKDSSFFTIGKDEANGTLGSGPGPLGHPVLPALRCEFPATREELPLLARLLGGGAICCSLFMCIHFASDIALLHAPYNDMFS